MPGDSTLKVFEDGRGRFGPMTDLRSAADIRTGALTTRERIEGVCEAPEGHVLAVNARAVVPPSDAELSGLGVGEALVEEETGDVIAARLGLEAWRAWQGRGEAPASLRRTGAPGRRLAARPWDVIRFRDAALALDLALLRHAETQELPDGCVSLGDHELTIAPDALVYPTVVLDLERGPIVIGAGATVRPGAVIIGPASIGPGSTIVERSLIKANTAIGPTCKVGGEIGGTIFQGFSNKSHDGHLGDSWVGEWVNLGAGTLNSNLLNTYGEVTSRAAHDQPSERTGLTFFGCVLGDHVKTAIGTRIMTGASVGTGTMWAAGAPVSGGVGPFRWVTDAGDRAHAWGRFEETMRAMMSRRHAAPDAAPLEALRALHAKASA